MASLRGQSGAASLFFPCDLKTLPFKSENAERCKISRGAESLRRNVPTRCEMFLVRVQLSRTRRCSITFGELSTGYGFFVVGELEKEGRISVNRVAAAEISPDSGDVIKNSALLPPVLLTKQ